MVVKVGRFFLAFFVLELLLRFADAGFWKCFTGKDAWDWNWFDVSVVSLAIVEETMEFLVKTVEGINEAPLWQHQKACSQREHATQK